MSLLPEFITGSLKDVWVNLSSIAIPSAFALYFASVRYVFEFGYCRYFGIPSYLIQFEVADIVIIGVQIVGLVLNSAMMILVANFAVERVSLDARFAVSFIVMLLAAALPMCWNIPYLVPVIFASYASLVIAGREVTTNDRRLRYGTLYVWGLLVLATFAQYLFVFGNAGLQYNLVFPALAAAFLAYLLFVTLLMYLPTILLIVMVKIDRFRIQRLEKRLAEGDSQAAPPDIDRWSVAMLFCISLLCFSYATSFGLGWLNGFFRTEYLYVESEPDFLLAATYGDAYVFREVVEGKEKGSFELGHRLKILRSEDIAKSTLLAKPMDKILLPYESPYQNFREKIWREIDAMKSK